MNRFGIFALVLMLSACSAQQTYWDANMRAGMSAYEKGSLSVAIKELKRAAWRAEQLKDPYKISVSYYELGRIYNRMDDFRQAYVHLFKSEFWYKNFKEPMPAFHGKILAELLIAEYALATVDEKITEEAKPHLNKLLEYRNLYTGQDKQTVDHILGLYAEVYEKRGDSQFSSTLKTTVNTGQ